jgi:hypothetical protein
MVPQRVHDRQEVPQRETRFAGGTGRIIFRCGGVQFFLRVSRQMLTHCGSQGSWRLSGRALQMALGERQEMFSPPLPRRGCISKPRVAQRTHGYWRRRGDVYPEGVA